jgi:hypothetical protein
MNETTERRLNALIDREACNSDAFYAAQISQLRTWLTMTELALEDEGIEPATVERILNRLVYGTPSGADAPLRRHTDEEMRKLIEDHGRPLVVNRPLSEPQAPPPWNGDPLDRPARFS